MNWRKRLLPICLLALAMRVSAQLPAGSVAPDFWAQDITGKTHHLYDLLDSGKIVLLEISATWCPPCWVYHTSNALQDLYNTHGPAGDNKLRVLWIEGDPNTNLNCLYGQAGCNSNSAGNFVAGTPYPILDNASIANAYQISYYPSIFVICPNKKCYEVDPLDAAGLWEKANQCPVAYGTNNAGIFHYSPGTELQELCGLHDLSPEFALTNLGSAPLVAATIELAWNNNTVQTFQWTGNLPTYGEALISLLAPNVGGDGSLSTSITNINYGANDADFSNNVRFDNFTEAQQFNSTQILLKIRTDSYGEETYWELRDDQGTVLEYGGNLEVGPNGGGAFPLGTPIGPGAYPPLTIVRDTLDLPANGCYSIHFSDAYGDGICCNFGTGYYKLYDLGSPTLPLIIGGEFGDYSHRGFGAGVLSTAKNPLQTLDIQLFPNPASEILNLSIDAPGASEISGNIYNSFAQLLHHFPETASLPGGNDWQLALSDWPAGVYFLQLKIGTETITRSFVVAR